MIPKIIHSCWLGKGDKPELVQRCMASWHQVMPETEGWTYIEWNEDSIAEFCSLKNLKSPISNLKYCQEAYAASKYAFVSDYVRLWALEQYGGLYMDVDFEVYKSFEPLLDCSEGAFVGKEGSKHHPPMLGVMAAEPHSPWIFAMKELYNDRTFIKPDGSFDMTTNVSFFAASGVHKPEWVHIYPVDYFCPVLTTGERVFSENTYCEHKGLHSWNGRKSFIQYLKAFVLGMVGPATKTKLIKLKRHIFG